MDNGTLFAEGEGAWPWHRPVLAPYPGDVPGPASAAQPPVPAHKPPPPSPRLIVTPTGEMALTYEPTGAPRTLTWLERADQYVDTVNPRNVLRSVIGQEAVDRLPTAPRSLGELFGLSATGLEWLTPVGDMVDLWAGGEMFRRGVDNLDPWQMIGGGSTQVAATLGMLMPGRPGQAVHAYFAPADAHGMGALVTPGLRAERARTAFADQYGHHVEDLDPAMPAVSYRERALGHITRPRVQRIGGFWDDLYLLQHRRRKGDPENPRDYEDAVRQAIAEADLQLRQPKSGIGWYDKDLARAFDIAQLRSSMFGRGLPWGSGWLSTEDVQALTTAFAVPLSYAQRPSRNFQLALELADGWASGGRIPIRRRDGRRWTQHPIAERHLQMLQQLIDSKGPSGTVEFLVEPHLISQLRDIRRQTGLWVDTPSMSIPGRGTDEALGAELFGRKGGSFYLALNGLQDSALDRWMTRGFNRRFGRHTGPGAPGHSGVFDRPRSRAEAAIMQRLVQDVGRQLGLPEKDAQAVRWYFEQDLHQQMGQRHAKPERYSQGAEAFVEASR